jgi:RNA polymerase sigma-54 factor
MVAIASRLGQQTTVRQAIGLTPALQQSIKLLELSNLALATLIGEALAENPLLEVAEAPAPARPQPLRRPQRNPAQQRPLPPGLARLFTGTRRQRPSAGGAGDGIADVAASGPSLQEHLLQQLGSDVPDPGDRAIGRALIEAVDDAGYLTSDADELARRLGHRPARIAAVLGRLQQFDPPGVFARSLSECLALQLADQEKLDQPMRQLLDNLDLLAKGDRVGLMSRCGVAGTVLTAMIAAIRRLDPRPGLVFDRSTIITVVPDLTIDRLPGGGWQIELNGQTLPRLTINENYPVPPSADAAVRTYLKERRTTAQWLLRALDRRAETLLRVAHELVLRQSDFLESGAGALKPLSRREVARVLDLHESTVGRATVNKYAATPRGVLALVDFFGGRLAAKSDSLGHAPAAVRARIKTVIGAESADRPISDERLAGLLRQEGVAIARRTVAKYREMLGIPPSFRRGPAKPL